MNSTRLQAVLNVPLGTAQAADVTEEFGAGILNLDGEYYVSECYGRGANNLDLRVELGVSSVVIS
jgi:hypothetical protein